MSDSDNCPLFAEIAVFNALEKTLHYRVPCRFRDTACVGTRALVPLGRREAVGLIVAIHLNPPDLSDTVTLRSLLAVLDSAPVVPSELIRLCRWISRYYFYPLCDVLQAALPSGMEYTPQTSFAITSVGREKVPGESASEVLSLLSREEKLSLTEILEKCSSRSPKNLQKQLALLEREGLIERVFEWEAPPLHAKTIRCVKLAVSSTTITQTDNDNLRRLIELLKQSGGSLPLRELRRQVNNAGYWIRKLEVEGVLQSEDREELRESRCAQHIPFEPPPSLTADQQRVVEVIAPHLKTPTFQPFLLHGVTGSGKTEIYLKLIEQVLELGKGALVLVPEIALSTQLEALFRQRFGSCLAVWHSGLSSGIRYDQWRQVLNGSRRIVLGVRSAVFMPVVRLGLILVDEEHDSSYKQEDRLRYHARDVALMRGSMLQIPVVLGSATPSLQTVHHCRSNRYMALSLSQRVLDRPFPSLHVVDMRRERGRNRILSHTLRESLLETVQNKEQALLFLNRRGFATFFLCRSCGNVVQCSHCSVSLTYHQKEDRLRCHYCGWEKTVPEHCPVCGHSGLVPHGFGTERIEEEVRLLMPQARIARFDRDTVSNSRQIVELLNAVRYQHTDILIGTQMIAKGHDFPNVTLVGVINADTALQIPDFRAGEATVQMLMQVAGRAGRGEKPGRVILQTYHPHHYTIHSVLNMDYLEFCDKELDSRERLQYPPYTRMLKILVTSPDDETTQISAYHLAELCREVAIQLHDRHEYLAVLGPAPAPLVKLKNRFRWHIYIKAWTNQALHQFTETVLQRSKMLSLPRHVQLAVDRDPVSGL